MADDDAIPSTLDVQLAAKRKRAAEYARQRRAAMSPEQYAEYRARVRAWRAATRERRNAKRREQRLTDIENERQRDRDRYQRIKEKRLARERQWRKDNPELAHAKDRREAEKSRKRRRLYAIQWRLDNPEKSVAMAMDYERRRIKSDPEYKLRRTIRRRVQDALRQLIRYEGRGNTKAGSAIASLGCSLAEFKRHIERQFVAGMSWQNWGRFGWHLDHIQPLASFDLTDPVQFAAACHYTNYQPLWWQENISKGNKTAPREAPPVLQEAE